MEKVYNDAIDDCLKTLEQYCTEFGYPRKYDELKRRLLGLKFQTAPCDVDELISI